jgi:hypothetical protein
MGLSDDNPRFFGDHVGSGDYAGLDGMLRLELKLALFAQLFSQNPHHQQPYAKEAEKCFGKHQPTEYFEIAFVNANIKPYEHKYKAVFNDLDDAQSSPSKPAPSKPEKLEPPTFDDMDDVTDSKK